MKFIEAKVGDILQVKGLTGTFEVLKCSESNNTKNCFNITSGVLGLMPYGEEVEFLGVIGIREVVNG